MVKLNFDDAVERLRVKLSQTLDARHGVTFETGHSDPPSAKRHRIMPL
jgi:hypothetical protein